MPAKLACCSKRSAKLKKVNFAKAKAAAQKKAEMAAGAHTHMDNRKAHAKKAPNSKKSKPCRACSKPK